MSIGIKIKKTLLILTIINLSFVFLEVDNANAQVVNNLPVAVDDEAFTAVGVPVDIEVLVNDFDIDGDPLTVVSITSSNLPESGTAVILSDGTIRYTPEPDFDGEDAFSYDISDGQGGTATGNVKIVVELTSSEPIARNDRVTTPEGTSITIDVLTNDFDHDATFPLMITAATTPSSGKSEINAGGQTITYTPNANFVGRDSFIYTIFDGVEGTDTATVTIDVTAVNEPPVLGAIGDKTAVENIALTFTATATDADIPAQTLSFSLVDAPPPGASITSAGVFTWTPTEAQGPGSYIFSVVVSDGTATDMETITIQVSEVNAAPVLGAIGDKTAVENIALTFTATATDADIPAQTLSFSLVDAPPPGASITSAGVFTWTPTEAQGPGSYIFSVVVSDGNATAKETIEVTVSEVTQIQNTPGKITAGGAQMNEDVNFGFNIQFSKNTLKGQLEYKDKAMKINLHSVTMTALHVSSDKTTGIFTGTATINGIPGYTFFVEVKDGGEPGKNDMLKLIILGTDYLKSGNLMKGNIQIH